MNSTGYRSTEIIFNAIKELLPYRDFEEYIFAMKNEFNIV
jgi:hypothetical protein